MIHRFTMVQFDGVFARNPVTDQPTPYLQWFVVTEDQSGETLDPAKLSPRVDLLHGMTEPIPMTRIVRRDDGVCSGDNTNER